MSCLASLCSNLTCSYTDARGKVNDKMSALNTKFEVLKNTNNNLQKFFDKCFFVSKCIGLMVRTERILRTMLVY